MEDISAFLYKDPYPIISTPSSVKTSQTTQGLENIVSGELTSERAQPVGVLAASPTTGGQSPEPNGCKLFSGIHMSAVI